MSSINGVHALLAVLMQQANSTKQGGEIKIDLKQLEMLLQESRLLNERLLSIERLLLNAHSPSGSSANKTSTNAPRMEGSWPAGGLVRDLINLQERQQSFGNWQSEAVALMETEPFNHRQTESEEAGEIPDQQQILIQRYIPTDSDLAWAELSANFGAHRRMNEALPDYRNKDAQYTDNQDRSRLVVIAIGIALLLFALSAAMG